MPIYRVKLPNLVVSADNPKAAAVAALQTVLKGHGLHIDELVRSDHYTKVAPGDVVSIKQTVEVTP